MTNIELLRKYSIFQQVDEHKLEKIAELAETKKYNCHKIIFNPGKKGGNLYFIKQGVVAISLPINGSQQYRRVAILRQGEYFGELSFLDGREHSARAEALEDVELLVLNNKDYQKRIMKNQQEGIEMQIKIILKVISLLRDMNKRYSFRPFA